jgi:hypothetical protein
MRRKVLRAVGALLAFLVLLCAGAYVAYRHPAPATRSGDADALARRMLSAVDADAWSRTGAVRWTFFNGERHLWDRARNLDRFDRGDIVVWIDLATQRGVAQRGGVTLSGAERDRAVSTAWSRWCNDSFWLNPVPKAFDSGVTRAVASDDAGRDALLLSYHSGGVTPGDRYLWLLDANGRPRAWRMWVSVLPVPGLEASWAGWQRLSTGAWISTEHRMGPMTLRLRDVEGAETLAALSPGPDPFAPLVTPGAAAR